MIVPTVHQKQLFEIHRLSESPSLRFWDAARERIRNGENAVLVNANSVWAMEGCLRFEISAIVPIDGTPYEIYAEITGNLLAEKKDELLYDRYSVLSWLGNCPETFIVCVQMS